MAKSKASRVCSLCGGPLDKRDIKFGRDTCHKCRSPSGKVADLDIAIRASGDNPARINAWPAIRHLLRKRFGADLSDKELWERCTDWLQAEGRLTPNDYLVLPLDQLLWRLEHGFPRRGQQVTGSKKRIQPVDEQPNELAVVNVEGMPPNAAATYAIAVTALNKANAALLRFDESSRLPKGDMKQRMKFARDGANAVCALESAIAEFDSRFVPRHNDYTAAFNTLNGTDGFPGPSIHESVHRFARATLDFLQLRIAPEGKKGKRIRKTEIEAKGPAAAKEYCERKRGPRLPKYRWGPLDAEALLRREAMAVANLEKIGGSKAGGKRYKGGRKPDTDSAEDATIAAKWNSGEFRNKAGLATFLEKPEREVKLALDRHRQRQRKKKLSRNNRLGK